jgi:hypothetical protein
MHVGIEVETELGREAEMEREVEIVRKWDCKRKLEEEVERKYMEK